jgi:6-phosphogluconolactonase
MSDLRAFETLADASVALAGAVANLLRAGIARRRAASLVVPGGSTPGPLFDALARERLDWSHVWVTLSDERWAAETSTLSNAAQVRRRLLIGPAAAAHFAPLFSPAPSPAAGLETAASAIAQIPRPFDAVVLGMGEDGHFASLFPGAPGLDDALALDDGDALIAVEEPQPGRISMTLRTLTHARHIFLLISGETKRDVIGLDPARWGHLPVMALLTQSEAPVSIYWAKR